MRSSEDMYNYSAQHNLICGDEMHEWGWNPRAQFVVIKENLNDGEEVLATMLPKEIRDERSNFSFRGYCALAVTARRIILGKARKKMNDVKVVSLEFVNDYKLSSFMFRNGMIEIDTPKEVMKIIFDTKAQAQTAFELIKPMIEDFRQKDFSANTVQVSSADEILKYKQLLDMGVITQEEFDIKKKQLLGI